MTSARKNIFPYLITFIITIIIGYALYLAKGIEPFGRNSVLCMDMWGQYFPMYVQNAKADSVSELLFSWNGGFGYNNCAQNAYYCNSVFLLLMRFLPLGSMITAINIFCILKMGLASVSCLAFLSRKCILSHECKNRPVSPILIAGSVAYGISAYMLAFPAQFMWTDCVIYAPLIFIGLDRLIEKKKPFMYTCMLAAAIISNFYIGFSICIFSCLYFISNALLLIRVEKLEKSERAERIGKVKRVNRVKYKKSGFHIRGIKNLLTACVRFGFSSLLAGGISAAVIIPAGLALQNTLAVDAKVPVKVEWYGDFLYVLQQMLSGKMLSLGFTGVNIAAGMIIFILIPFYFFNKNIRILERCVNAVFLVILFLSINCNILDYMWHGFHFPNQLPGRWTFMFILFMIFLSCRAAEGLTSFTVKRALAAAVVSCFLIYHTLNGSADTSPAAISKTYIIIFAFEAFAVLCIALGGKPASNAARMRDIVGFIPIVIACLWIYDSADNFIRVAQFTRGGLRVSDIDMYNSALRRVNGAGDELKKLVGSDEFYRAELEPRFTFNSSMIGDYRGMGYYSSTMAGGTFNLLKYLGNRVYANNVSSVYNMTSPVQNSLFSIKYYISNLGALEYVPPGAELLKEYEEKDIQIYKNPTALSLAYQVSENAAHWNVTDEVRSISNQNSLLNAMCGQDMQVFKKIPAASFTYENVSLYENDNWNRNYFYLDKGASFAKFDYSYVCDKTGPVYLEHNFRAGSIRINSKKVNMAISPNIERFKYLGDFEKGDVINININIENVKVGCYGINLYNYDGGAWTEAYEKLSAHQMNITSFKNTEIKGGISLDEDGLVFIGLADDVGWTILCDGHKIDTVKLGGALIGVRLEAGKHDLVFRYHVPGLLAGMAISMISLAILTGSLIKNIKL